MSQIGFIGLGMMGNPMAHLIHKAGHTVVVRDTNVSAAAAFAESHTGAIVAKNEVDFSECDAVITMLPNSDIVEAVVKDLAPHLKRGCCIIEMSSADPTRTRSLAKYLDDLGVGLVDAPVSGGVKKAQVGTLAIMVGGEQDLFDQQKPLLSIMGKSISRVGQVGAGHALKALNNYVSAAALIATAEAIQVGAAFGIDREVIVDVINASTGKNNTTENKAHQYMLNGAFNSGFSLALQAKDVGIAASLGIAVKYPMELAQKVYQMTADASQSLGAKADHTELYVYVDKKAI